MLFILHLILIRLFLNLVDIEGWAGVVYVLGREDSVHRRPVREINLPRTRSLLYVSDWYVINFTPIQMTLGKKCLLGAFDTIVEVLLDLLHTQSDDETLTVHCVSLGRSLHDFVGINKWRGLVWFRGTFINELSRLFAYKLPFIDQRNQLITLSLGKLLQFSIIPLSIRSLFTMMWLILDLCPFFNITFLILCSLTLSFTFTFPVPSQFHQLVL